MGSTPTLSTHKMALWRNWLDATDLESVRVILLWVRLPPKSQTNINFNDKMMEKYVQELKKWLGKDNIRYFKHLKGLTGEVFPVLKLNFDKKGLPAHPVAWREGMQIRNYLRSHFIELNEMEGNKLDDLTIQIMEKVIK